MTNVTTSLRLKSLVLMAALVATAVLGLAAPCLACYSGLIIIPTADMVGPRGYDIELELDGPLAQASVDTRLLNSQFGISPRLEAGTDFDLSEDADPRILGNFKYLVASSLKSAPAIAIGMSSIGRHTRSSPYLVATHDFKSLRGHLGVTRIEGNNRWFAGMDRAVTDRLTLMADYTNGDENFSSVGFDYEFNERFAIDGGVQFPNAKGADTVFTLEFVFTGS